jgi:hypothetical protein
LIRRQLGRLLAAAGHQQQRASQTGGGQNVPRNFRNNIFHFVWPRRVDLKSPVATTPSYRCFLNLVDSF